MKQKKIPNTISLIAAGACNLQCQYCTIDRTRNKNSQKIFNETLKALKNNSYLKNINLTLNKLKFPKEEITNIEIWGQEPSMILTSLTTQWHYWQKNFSNLNRIFFSTNGMDFIDDIYNFIITIEKNALQPIELVLQLSYDGEYGENNIRGGKAEKIKDNFIYLNTLLNQTFFNLVKIKINPHGVISTKIIKDLNTIEKVDQYFNEIENFLITMKTSSTNRNVYWNNFTLQLQNGFEATTEDGINLTSFLQRCSSVQKKKHYEILKHPLDFSTLAPGATFTKIYEQMKQNEINTIDDYIEQFFYKNKQKESPFCHPIFGDLKIMYDGSILICQNYMFDTQIDAEKISNNIFDQSRYNITTHGNNISPLKVTNNELNKYLSTIDNLLFGDTATFMIHSIVNLMIILSKTGQISSSYAQNIEKTVKHACLLFTICCCPFNILIASGSQLIRNTSEIRFYCNGALDLIEEYLNLGVQNVGK